LRQAGLLPGLLPGLLLGLACLLQASSALALPRFEEVKAAHRPSDSTLLSRHGEPLQTLRTDPQVRRLAWVPLDSLSPALLHAIVLSEDKRFWQHSGIDWAGVARASWANTWNRRTQGASTLTMQLAGLLDEGLARPAGGRSIGQKIGQAYTATQLESRWTKSQILETYLNSVPLRGELVGVEALAQTLFRKHASGLDLHEAAITASLVRAPNASAARVAERACELLQAQQMPCAGLPERTQAAFQRSGTAALGEVLAPHLARLVFSGAAPTQARDTPPPPAVRSTLDARLQRLALAALREQLGELSGRQVEDGAIVVLDNRSGEVLAWVGSSGPGFSSAAQVDGVLARRQPGSTLKPFVYQLALEQRLLTAASLLDDAPTQINTGGGLYVPQNYDRRFRGWVSVREALASSLNIPAVRAHSLLPPDALLQRLNALGLQLPHTGGYYGQALALGSAEVSLLGLSNAYRALANGGQHTPVRWLPALGAQAERSAGGRATPSGSADAPRAAASFIVADILADNTARASSFGLDSVLALPGWAAVKTGTSKDMRDNWCIGFSTRYTVGAWVGNASGAPMHDVSGISGAAPIWRRLMLALHEGQGWGRPALPAGTVRVASAPEAVPSSGWGEWFVAGTEQRARHSVTQDMPAQAQPFGIIHPRDGSLFALDPDIPPAAQRLVIEGEAGQWLLNGQRLAPATPATAGVQRIAWPLWPGRHRLHWTSANGQHQQTVAFEVRGARLKPPSAPSAPSAPDAPRPALSR
jgi:penicillin-binding protein 1C